MPIVILVILYLLLLVIGCLDRTHAVRTAIGKGKRDQLVHENRDDQHCLADRRSALASADAPRTDRPNTDATRSVRADVGTDSGLVGPDDAPH